MNSSEVSSLQWHGLYWKAKLSHDFPLPVAEGWGNSVTRHRLHPLHGDNVGSYSRTRSHELPALTAWQAVPPINTCSKETAERSKALWCLPSASGRLQLLPQCLYELSLSPSTNYRESVWQTHQTFGPATSEALTCRLGWAEGAGSREVNRFHLHRVPLFQNCQNS